MSATLELELEQVMVKKREQTSVKLDREVIRMANIVTEQASAASQDGSKVHTSDYLSALLRPLVERDYAKAVRQMAKSLPASPEK